MAISVDQRKEARLVWEKVVDRRFTVLSDPDGVVTRSYGIVHEGGGPEGDIALDTSILVGTDGRELWRKVSQTLPDLLTAEQTLEQIRKSLANPPPKK